MDINLSDIVISKIDPSPIEAAIKQRWQALTSQMNPEAEAQFLSDAEKLEFSVKNTGDGISFKVDIAESFLMKYLENHDTPVAGGENGIAHNVDGSTYASRVPKQLWGTPLPDLELPEMDSETEAKHIIELMAPDAVSDAARKSKEDISKEYVIPFMRELFGGD